MLIAQISDSHVLTGGCKLGGRFDTGANFDRLIANLAAQPIRPDLIVCSGDLGEDATPDEYNVVGNGLRSLGIPVMVVPGNHDKRAPMLSALPDMVGRTEAGHLCQCRIVQGMALVGLDTLVEGAPHGTLCEKRLGWLECTLRHCADREVVLFMHHPPIITGLHAMDAMGLLNGRAELAELVARHGKVRAILCGHMHRAIYGTCGNVPVIVSPSVSHQIAFDLRPGAPYAFTDEAPQYMLHVATSGVGLVSHVVRI
ncbi:phosphodiesterase [Xanthobacter sp. TB0139]|uniref:phosphodiesterase n=1 Tax=Xanthobacter sp. TB0139 TaxID=3459178 RepID=UPI00403A4902